MEPRIWSYSALSQYQKCPLQFFFQRVLFIKPAYTPANLAFGSAIHEALAGYHQSLKQDQPANQEAIRCTFLDAWASRKKQEKVVFTEAISEQGLLEKGVALLEAYLKEPPPQGIIGVELSLLTPLHNSHGEILASPMKSVIDLLCQDPGGLMVTDFKTSARIYSEMEAELSLQATCYANAINENFQQVPSFEYVVLVKTKLPKIQRIPTSRNEDDFARLGDLVQTVERAVQADVFYPIESPLNCSSCPFRKPCR